MGTFLMSFPGDIIKEFQQGFRNGPKRPRWLAVQPCVISNLLHNAREPWQRNTAFFAETKSCEMGWQ
jgi:hypothetical protein